MAYQQLPDEVGATKEELLKLQEWRDEVGIPAQQKNEELQLVIEEKDIEAEQLRTELESVRLELQTYSNEVEKLRVDKQDLQEELTNLNKLSSAIDPLLAQKTLTEKEEEIENLQINYDKSQSQLRINIQTMNDLKRENDQLRQENKQYEAILDKLQREETTLKDKINKETQELRDMKQKYEELEQEYQQQEAWGKKQSVWAQEILVEVDDLRNQYQNHLTTIETDDSQEQFDPTNSRVGSGHSPAKTIRIGPQTLRLANDQTLRLVNMESEQPLINGGHQYQQSYNPVFNTPQVGKVDRESQYKLRLDKAASTVSVDYGKNAHIISPKSAMQYVQYDTRESLSSEDEDDMKQATDSDLAAGSYFEIKEQLQTEFDDVLAREKGKLIEKHKGEMKAMRQELAEYTDQLKEFKKRLVAKDQEIRKLKRDDGVKNGGRGQTTNPNNQGDACGQCKVFSWRSW